MNDNNEREVVKYARALLLLQLHALTKSDELMKPELLLHRAGLSTRDIAELLGKNPAAVVKAIQRAGKGGG